MYNGLSDVLKILQEEHYGLAQELHQYDMALQSTVDACVPGDLDWKHSVQELRVRAIGFAAQLKHHLRIEDEQLLPELQACLSEEDTVPSLRFSSLLMEQYFWSGLSYLNLFIDQTEQLIEFRSTKDLKRMLYYLREALIHLSEYFKVEQEYVLLQAVRVLEDDQAEG
ncbi:hypothetical protein A8990_101367 [Paenibacillus taihuensis]|uniref:Hemerythrin HHE cation binding domain-containing protein n=1 Tax=Paenibacillus taihuensis TaxID=1156355 RepID=A0A3D9SS81_9BACL|nr:hypothetical protein [Paenibacillus taihuensis]REE94571.1 hypothetical protein A8990_101367 [Paenibacillus taihuensis]